MSTQHCTTKRAKPKPRMTVAGTELVYRTVPMTRKQAEATKRMFEHNPRFAGATVEPSKQAKGLFFVAFVPAAPERQVAMQERYLDERQARADASDGWIWSDDDSHVATPHQDPDTGEIVYTTYAVTDADCQCDDFKHRGAKIGMPCKHMIARQERISLKADRERLAVTVRTLNETGCLPGEEPGQFATAPAAPLPSLRDRKATVALFD